jgi:arylsulfatase A-like enzyme
MFASKRTYLSRHGFSSIWIVVIVVSLMMLCGCTPSEVDKRPNIVLIMADDLGREAIGCYGGQSYQTPAIDRLADEGMRFDHCYSTPLCTPSRVQIMTGKYNFRNYLGFGILDSTETTFGDIFREAGYTTCIAGKWQLYGNQRQQTLVNGLRGSRPEEAGFDRYCLWQVEDRGFRYKDPTVETTEQGLQTHQASYGPDVFLEYIEDFIGQHKDEPFFVYYPMCLVHDPFLPTPDTDEFEDYQSSEQLNDTTYFRDMVRYMDHVVGRIAEVLTSHNLHENTLVLFTGDNGTDRDVISTFRGQRIPGRKGYPEEYGTHVPLIAWWPGTIRHGAVNSNLVDFTDFLPTIIEATDIALPDDFATDGLSFYPQLIGQQGEVREWVFCHYDPNWGGFEKARYVHNKNWKLYENGEIYHIAADPFEKSPISAQALPAAVRPTVMEFREVLDRMTQ